MIPVMLWMDMCLIQKGNSSSRVFQVGKESLSSLSSSSSSSSSSATSLAIAFWALAASNNFHSINGSSSSEATSFPTIRISGSRNVCSKSVITRHLGGRHHLHRHLTMTGLHWTIKRATYRATQGWFHPTSVSIWHLHAFLAVPRQHWPREAQQTSDLGTCGPSSHSCLQFCIFSLFYHVLSIIYASSQFSKAGHVSC